MCEQRVAFKFDLIFRLMILSWGCISKVSVICADIWFLSFVKTSGPRLTLIQCLQTSENALSKSGGVECWVGSWALCRVTGHVTFNAIVVGVFRPLGGR